MQTSRIWIDARSRAATLGVTLLALLGVAGCLAQAATFTTLYSFQGEPDGKIPMAAVVLDAGGALYGTTYRGGTSGMGTVFQLAPPSGVGAWTESILHNFTGPPDGMHPFAGLVFGVGGNAGSLFGTTVMGGTGGGSGGTVFEVSPPSAGGGNWSEAVLYDFSGGGKAGRDGAGDPEGTLLVEPDGTVFGTTHGSCYSGTFPSTVFKMTGPASSGGAWTLHNIFSFIPGPSGHVGGGGGAEGWCPTAGVISQGGALYGATYEGASACGEYPAFGCGAAYALNPPAAPGGVWTGTPLHVFLGPPDGAYPSASLTAGPGGVLYGTTYVGGTGGCGLNGGFPYAEGGCGAAFQLAPPAAPGGAWTESVIYSFTGGSGDGAYPAGGLVLGPNGALYGATAYGGSGSPCVRPSGTGGCGTVFQLTPPASPGGAWTETVLYSFSGQNGDGATPLAGLTLGPGNVLYGTTSAGGTAAAGTVFSLALN